MESRKREIILNYCIERKKDMEDEIINKQNRRNELIWRGVMNWKNTIIWKGRMKWCEGFPPEEYVPTLRYGFPPDEVLFNGYKNESIDEDGQDNLADSVDCSNEMIEEYNIPDYHQDPNMVEKYNLKLYPPHQIITFPCYCCEEGHGKWKEAWDNVLEVRAEREC